MLIEIRGVGFVNKGAELMLYAILEQLSHRYPHAKFCMTPSKSQPFYQKRARLGLYQKVSYIKAGFDFGDKLISLISKKRRSMYGLVRDKEVSVVLDAAGFAHGDQWGVRNTQKLLQLSKRWKKNGTIVVLLPQAFGPFENEEVASLMQKLVKNCDLIFSREKLSHQYLSKLSPNANIIQRPDFTNLVQPKKAENFDFTNNNFCIIPNYKMVSKSWKKENSNNYISTIAKAIIHLKKRGKKPFILIHEGRKDLELAKEIEKHAGTIAIHQEQDPLVVKGIIAQCDGAIGSRFHSLVSALSQGVPTLGTSWSHKYEMLFEEYDFKEGIINLSSENENISQKLDFIIDNAEILHQKLIKASDLLKQESNQMWQEVFQLIDKINDHKEHRET